MLFNCFVSYNSSCWLVRREKSINSRLLVPVSNRIILPSKHFRARYLIMATTTSSPFRPDLVADRACDHRSACSIKPRSIGITAPFLKQEPAKQQQIIIKATTYRCCCSVLSQIISSSTLPQASQVLCVLTANRKATRLSSKKSNIRQLEPPPTTTTFGIQIS